MLLELLVRGKSIETWHGETARGHNLIDVSVVDMRLKIRDHRAVIDVGNARRGDDGSRETIDFFRLRLVIVAQRSQAIQLGIKLVDAALICNNSCE